MLTFGGLMICAAVLGLAAAALVFRRPDPPRWTTSSWAGEGIAIAIVTALALGLGYLGVGVIRASQEGVSLLDLGLLLGVLVATCVIWRRLGVRQRLRALSDGATQPAVVRGLAGQDLRPAGSAPAATGSPAPAPADRAA